MLAGYLVITLLAAACNGMTGVGNLIGLDYPKRQADMLRVPRSWVRPLGTLLTAGAAGLLAGFAVPPLGRLAAAGLVLYFLGALVAHVRVRDRHLGLWALFFCLAAAALAVNLAYHGLATG